MTATVTRRTALRTLAAGGFAAAFHGLGPASGQPPAGRKMTIDLVCGNIGVKATLPEAIALAAKHGFESVAPDAGFLAGLSDAQLADLQSEMKGKRLVFGAAGLGVNFRGDDETFRAGLKTLPRDARALQRAGVTRVGTWLSPGHNRLTYLANFRQHTDRLREVTAVLGDHGLRFGLEYVGPKTSWSALKYPFIHTMPEARELIAAIGRDNVGLVLDSWHWYCAGESPDDIKALANKDVVAVDLNDAPKGIPVDRQRDSVRELPATTGVIDLKGFLSALLAIGYDGPVHAEPFKADLRKLPPDEAVAQTARSMRAAFALIGG
jgi:sugar phosphate isomerase/epimerase